ncbi:hypothetical protein CRG98_050336, partial [Punica granatum]
MTTSLIARLQAKLRSPICLCTKLMLMRLHSDQNPLPPQPLSEALVLVPDFGVLILFLAMFMCFQCLVDDDLPWNHDPERAADSRSTTSSPHLTNRTGEVVTFMECHSKIACYGKESASMEISCSKCAICLDDFMGGDQCRVLAHCRHAFHRACVEKWLLLSDLHCPICRRHFPRRQVELQEYTARDENVVLRYKYVNGEGRDHSLIVRSTDSWLWKTIARAWNEVFHGVGWITGDESRARFWEDQWIPGHDPLVNTVLNIQADSRERV